MSSTLTGVDFLKRLGLAAVALFFASIAYQSEASEERQKIQILTSVTHTGTVSSIAFSPDGKVMVSGSLDKSIKLWNAGSGRLLRTLTGHSGVVSSVAFSPDGRTTVSGSSEGILRFWDVASGRLLRTLNGHSDEILSIAFSPDGETAVSGSLEGTIKFWHAASGNLLRTLNAHTGGVYSIAFSPDGQTIASRGRLDIKIWEVASDSLLHTLEGHSDRVTSISFSPDGSTLVSGSRDRTIKLWDVGNGQLIRTFEAQSGKVLSVAFSAEGKTIVSGSEGTLKCWDAASGRLLRTLKDHSMEGVSAAFSPDGRVIAFASLGGALKLWDAALGRLIRTLKNRSMKDISAAFSPDGSTIVSSGLGGTLTHWDTATGRLIRTVKGHSDYISSIAVSPDGALMVTSSENVIKLWDAPSGRSLRALEGHSNIVTSVAFSPDGRSIVSGSRDRTLKLWDAASGRLLQTMEGHSGEIDSVAFSPDGKRIVSASSDATLKLWDVEYGSLLLTLVGASADNGDEESSWLAMTPEGFFAASAHGSKLLHVAQGIDVIGIDQIFDTLYRPDLVREKLAGDPNNKVLLAAQKLDLRKVLESGAPPRVKIATPVNNIRIQGSKITIDVDLTDRGGGIGRVEFRVNGVNKGNAFGGSGQPTVKRKELEFSAEENVIEVVAYNSQGLIASLPVKVTVKVDKTAINKLPTLYVMAIGANDYSDPALRLKYAASDASALTRVFEKIGQDKDIYSNVIIKSLLNSEITKETVSTAFADLSQIVQAHDVFFLYVSGHGKTVGGKYVFVPPNFRLQGRELPIALVQDGLGQDNWRTWLGSIKAEKSFLIFDTYESDTGAHSKIINHNTNLEYRAAIHKLSKATGRTVMASSGPAEIALQGYRAHGVLAYALLEGLATADSSKDYGNGNGRIELHELIEHVRYRVPQITELITKNNPSFKHPYRLRPQYLVRGVNYTITKAFKGVFDANAGATAKIPTRPTHVVIKAADLFANAGGRGVAIRKLSPGLLVTVVETKGGWVLVAKDGSKRGFVEHTKLAPVR